VMAFRLSGNKRAMDQGLDSVERCKIVAFLAQDETVGDKAPEGLPEQLLRLVAILLADNGRAYRKFPTLDFQVGQLAGLGDLAVRNMKAGGQIILFVFG